MFMVFVVPCCVCPNPLLSVSVSVVPHYVSLVLTGTSPNTVNELFDPA